MHLKTILYPVRGTIAAKELSPIIEICRQEKLHLSIVVFCDMPLPPVMTAQTSLNVGHWTEQMIETEDSTLKQVRAIQDQIMLEGLSADVRAEFGHGYSTSDAIGLHARYADLTMMVRDNAGRDSFQPKAVSGVLFHSGKPLLLFPPVAIFSLAFKNILIAWDGDVPSCRAVCEALPLLQQADSTRILCINPDHSDLRDKGEPGWDLATYLSRHRVATTVDVREEHIKSVSDVLADCAREHNTDLIVMGAYGHSRVRQRFLGGTTSKLLSQSAVPLFLVH